MAKTLYAIQSLSNINLVIEIVDARAIRATTNQTLTKHFQQTKLIVALKSDLADVTNIKLEENMLIGSIKDKHLHKRVINKLNEIFEKKMDQFKQKGLLNPTFYGVVVGLPNVGKSSFINLLNPPAKLLASNYPGTTKKKQLIRVNKNYFLYDTPGVLIKKNLNTENIYRLALVGIIKKELLPMREVLMWGYEYLKKHYLNMLLKKYELTNAPDFNDFLKFICRKYFFISSKNFLDENRGLNFLYNDWLNNLKINYEK